MVITVKQHQIAARQQRIGYYFIGRRGPVQHKVGFIRVENFRGKFLRMFRRAFMNQQIAKLNVGVAHIRAKQILTKELVEMAPRGMLFKELTVLMSWAGKCAVPHLDILSQRVIERRQQIFFILTGSRLQLQPVLRLTANDRIHARRQINIRLCEQKHGYMKTGAFQQSKDPAAAIRNGNDDCRNVSKISTVQRHHLTMAGQTRNQFSTGGNFH